MNIINSRRQIIVLSALVALATAQAKPAASANQPAPTASSAVSSTVPTGAAPASVGPAAPATGSAVSSAAPTPSSRTKATTAPAEVGSIDALEKKFFEHTYANDAQSRRLERLEKLVFGEARAGTTEERLANLLTTVPLRSEQSSGIGSGAKPTKRQSGPSIPSDYPAVSTLENQILGAYHRTDPIRSRLDRLEIKAFGNPSNCGDLSVRVSDLQKYARDKGLAPQPTTVTYVPPPPASATTDAKVDWLEQQVYGRAVPDRPIYQRVHRLNLSILPHEYLGIDGSIPDNVATLISAVELDQATNLIDADGQRSKQYQPMPRALPREYSKSEVKPNKTAATLERIGMPSPLNDLGVSPSQIASVAPDADDDTGAGKKKKKGGGFWHTLKEAIEDSSSDRYGIPSYAYGNTDNN